MNNGLFKVREYDSDHPMTVYLVDENEDDGIVFLVYDAGASDRNWRWIKAEAVCPA